MIRTGSAFGALMMVGALLMAGDPNLATPRAIRKFSENSGKKLRRQLTQAQADPEPHALFKEEYDPPASELN